jgi:hypothetical protein
LKLFDLVEDAALFVLQLLNLHPFVSREGGPCLDGSHNAVAVCS